MHVHFHIIPAIRTDDGLGYRWKPTPGGPRE